MGLSENVHAVPISTKIKHFTKKGLKCSEIALTMQANYGIMKVIFRKEASAVQQGMSQGIRLGCACFLKEKLYTRICSKSVA